MLHQYLKNLLLDRLSLRATNRLRRRLKHNELSRFFSVYNSRVEDIVTRAEQDMDKMIDKYLDELKAKEGK